MKLRDVFILTLFVLPSLSYSQIKRAYVDDNAEATTVVVKEDRADDLSILMSQFDLSEVSMNDEVRITTGDWAFKGPKSKPSTSIDIHDEPMASLNAPLQDFTVNQLETKPKTFDVPTPELKTKVNVSNASSTRISNTQRKRQKVKFKRPMQLFKKTRFRTNKCPQF